MEPVEPEIIRERIKIARNTSWLRSRCGVGDTFAPASAVEGDDAVSGPSKARDLARPNGAGAGVGVEQHQWHPCAAGVCEPQFRAGEFGVVPKLSAALSALAFRLPMVTAPKAPTRNIRRSIMSVALPFEPIAAGI